MSQLPAFPVIPIHPVSTREARPASTRDPIDDFQPPADIYARAVSGWYAGWRWTFVWLTQILFYGMPWLRWNGRQAVLFDLESQRFYILGLVLHPQDLIYLAALLVICALALFLFTAVAGRLWCGYSCPQTVYTEMFMWVERKLEGDRAARMRLDKAPWGPRKMARKSAKQVAWLAIGLATGVSFVGYFTPMRELVQSIGNFSVSPWNGFWILFYGLMTYGNAGYLREQMCKYMCPYARFQSALIDKDSLIITYDVARGDPRGARSRKTSAEVHGLGDCVDCHLCVQVCPTGIDIRKGLQNECIGCAACIDACNGVMDKMGYQPGLIRYSTQNGVVNGWSPRQMYRRALRPRVLIYGVVLLAAAAAFAISIAGRSPFLFDVIKDRGALARVVDDGAIENVYRLQIMNRTETPQTYEVAVSGVTGLTWSAPSVTVPATGIESVVVRLRLPESAARPLQGRSAPVIFEVTTGRGVREPPVRLREKSAFFVPR